jgi:transposase
MVYQKLDAGQKLVAARLYDRGRDTVAEITDVSLVSRATLYRSVRRYRATGSVVVPKSHLQGRPRLLNRDDLNYCIEHVRLRPTVYLKEVQRFLVDNRHLDVTPQTIHNTFVRSGITYKKLNRAARERRGTSRRISLSHGQLPSTSAGLLG